MKPVSRLCVVASLVTTSVALQVSREPTLPSKVLPTCQLSAGQPPVVFDLFIREAPTNVSVPEHANMTEAQKKATLDDALATYKDEKRHFEQAEAALMRAMTALLKVPEMDPEGLQKLQEGGEPTLVVFYAPWCPHCQNFVLHDEDGDPTRAPLELLREELVASNVSVARVDTSKHQDLPSAFVVMSIPAVYFVNSVGTVVEYQQDPSNFDLVKQFVGQNRNPIELLHRQPEKHATSS